MAKSDSSSSRALPDTAFLIKRRRRRMLLDHLARYGVGIGGIGVIIAITLIFFYLAMVVLPLFKPATIEPVAHYSLPGNPGDDTLLLSMEEQAEIAMRFTRNGSLYFFAVNNGRILQQQTLDLPSGAEITAFAQADPASAVFAVGLSDGSVMVIKPHYEISYPNDRRLITPKLEYPLGEAPIELDPQGKPIRVLAVQSSEEGISLAAATDQQLLISAFETEESLFDDEISYEQSGSSLALPSGTLRTLLLDTEQRLLYAVTETGLAHAYDISDKEDPLWLESVQIVPQGRRLSDIRFQAGSISLLIATDDGEVAQWFPVRDANNDIHLRQIRTFSLGGSALLLAPEYARKAFVAADRQGTISLVHTTAERIVLQQRVEESPIHHAAISPRANRLLLETADGRIRVLAVDNKHPEISWSSLWGKVWYENYPEPQYVWQSSSASNDFEPKFSLTPLSFGTLKAAFYAMLLAMPLAILGAIFTAYFMAPKLRQTVKPTIEIMEALPTVILGFLAGLWLAPFLEGHLPGIFSLLIILPVGILLFAFLWTRLPDSLRHRIPDGWQPVLLIPAVLLVGWFAIAVSPVLENVLFNGDMPLWLREELGIGFDQRNSIVVGLAMGFAVIPTIFSIAEDAIFNVPRHLTMGSLALGATPWQTFTRVVLLTASPGIFSAVMIGLGRAVGETMIVLMATGNTPVMDLSIFQGMRTLSANIAVEMPESEVGSTHYRVLFLAALVLFAFTFFFNTLAEIVRQRLRRKYSSL